MFVYFKGSARSWITHFFCNIPETTMRANGWKCQKGSGFGVSLRTFKELALSHVATQNMEVPVTGDNCCLAITFGNIVD